MSGEVVPTAPSKVEIIREKTSQVAYVLGVLAFLPFWFAFWFWFFIDLILESVHFQSPVTTVQRLYGCVVLAIEVIIGKVRPPSKVALSAASDDEVEVLHVSQEWISFKMIHMKPTWYPKLHFIIFPGPFYSPMAYAPLARELCKRGSIVSIWNTTFSSAHGSDMKSLRQKIAESTDVKWVLLGHSLGGVQVSRMARMLKDENQIDKVTALVYLANFPNSGDLAGIEVPTLTVHGSNDTIARKSKHAQNTRHFPKKSEIKTILGANHSQFASVSSALPLDGTAEISEAQQLQQTAAVVLDFLARHTSPPGEAVATVELEPEVAK